MGIITKCCCFHIRSGAVVLGTLGMIIGIMGIISLTTARRVPADKDDDDKYSKDLIYNYTEHSKNSLKEIEDEVLKLKNNSESTAVWLAFHVVCSAMLIIGAVKKNRFLLLPWLVIEAIEIVSAFFTAISCSILLGGFPGLVIFITVALLLNLTIYFWLCVFSLYQTFVLEQHVTVMATIHIPCNKEMKPTYHYPVPPVEAVPMYSQTVSMFPGTNTLEMNMIPYREPPPMYTEQAVSPPSYCPAPQEQGHSSNFLPPKSN